MPRLFSDYELRDGLPAFMTHYTEATLAAPKGLVLSEAGMGQIMATAISGTLPKRLADTLYQGLPVWVDAPPEGRTRIIDLLRPAQPQPVIGEEISPERLRSWRRLMGLTQAELATRWGYSDRTILNYENGNTPIPKLIGLYIEAVGTRA